MQMGLKNMSTISEKVATAVPKERIRPPSPPRASSEQKRRCERSRSYAVAAVVPESFSPWYSHSSLGLSGRDERGWWDWCVCVSVCVSDLVPF